jgi:endonuclease/exonuclease/phosphatase family metal-dependent hydrolase
MIKQLKQFTVNLMAGANVATVLLMVLVGYSDRISPAEHPLLSSIGMTFPAFLLANLLFLFFWLIFKWRKAWIPVVGYLLAYVPISIYIPLNKPGDTEEASLKLVSWNVCCYGGGRTDTDYFEDICGYLKEQKADIVCLQEDVDSWRGYFFREYAKVYPYNDTTVFCKNSQTMNGLGIHSRYPILKKERIEYESVGNGSVAYYLKVGADTLLVINNHLEGTHLTKADRLRYTDMLRGNMNRDTARAESRFLLGKLGVSSAKRAPQAEAVHRYVADHSRYPIILCGDFNDTPISYSRHTIAEGLTDCFSKSGNGLGLSYNQKGFYFRIDHIFCSSHYEPLSCQVDSKIDYSDHYPVVCWLKKRNNP